MLFGGVRGRKKSNIYGEFTNRDGLKFLNCERKHQRDGETEAGLWRKSVG